VEVGRAAAIAELLAGAGETVRIIGRVTEGQGVAYRGALA
jgi:hypothetical protein